MNFQADEVFLRVGDKSKLQTFEERLQLNYDKGERYFEDKAVPDATIDDIDMDFVKEYTDKIDYGKSPLEYLKENRGFIKEKDGEIQISTAAILLFGKNPQNFSPVQGFVLYVMRGHNRMCNELEQVRLKDPVYHTNAFMLQPASR